MEESSNDVPWRGCSMQEIYRNIGVWELSHVPAVCPSEAHTVLYHVPIKNVNEPPKPLKGFNKWDSFHVRLPCCLKNQYPITKADGTECIQSRWEMIEQALLQPIKNSRELETAIKFYNSKYENFWNFVALHKLFEEELDEAEAKNFFNDLLPQIIRLALCLPEIIQTSIPLLKQGQSKSISLSQQQTACLLANAFLCTFPRRNTMKKKSEYSSFPDINFNRFWISVPCGVITMTRRYLPDSELPKWAEYNAPLGVTPLHISSAGTIEGQGKGLLQVDFANKYLGGGVLGSGCVQEEIRFVICPELIVSKLFTEALKPNEALVMVGCEQFSQYSGYASTFIWNGNFVDETPFDESRRRQCNIVAIDALCFVQSSHQYREDLMLRELNKAYIGFFHPLDTPAPGIASGNWGCGAFGGEATLKALLQLMACTVTKRPLVYFTFGNHELRDAVHNIHTFFIENNVTVRQLWRYLKEFPSYKLLPNDLYSFIYQIHRDYQRKKTLMNSQELSTNGGGGNPPTKESSTEQSTKENTVKDDNQLNERTENETNKPGGIRQRSLIEMLDMFYTGSPAKRYCVSGKRSE